VAKFAVPADPATVEESANAEPIFTQADPVQTFK